jgi:hypothetical protein
VTEFSYDDRVDAAAVALFENLADEYDCWDEDPLERGRRWRGMAERALEATSEDRVGYWLDRYESEYRTDWSSRPR